MLDTNAGSFQARVLPRPHSCVLMWKNAPLLLCITLGCTAEGSSGWDRLSSRTQVSESAGVDFLQLSLKSRTGRMEIQFLPVLSFGAPMMGGSYLENPVDLIVQSGGEMRVLDQGTHEIVFFDSLGREIRRAGRLGAGPGELGEGLHWLLSGSEGTMYVPNPSFHRIDRFSSQGVYRSSSPLPFGSGPTLGYAVTDEGEVLRAASDLRKGPHGLGEFAQRVFIYSLKGDSAALAGVLVVGRTPHTGLYVSMPVWAAGPGGYWVASNETSEVIRFDRFMVRREIWQIPIAAERIRRSDQGVLLDKAFDKLDRAVRSRAIAFLRARVPFARVYPRVSRIIIDPAGNLWINRSATAKDITEGHAPGFSFDETGSVQWYVFDVHGTFVMIAFVPPGFILKRIVGGRLYGIGRTAEGEAVVQVLASARSMSEGGLNMKRGSDPQ